MWVKICGITNPEDALAAVDAGARALGFIFVSRSPRCVAPEQIEPWIGQIPSGVWKVGVFENETPEAIERISARLGLNVAQLHGAETPENHPRDLRIWKAFRVAEAAQNVPDYPAAEAILIDGISWDWVRTGHFTRPLILAGGLDETNVAARIALSRPWAVDVSSGIESSPGRKNHARMKKFIEAALQS
jgi:phosphoribosylanthranilate isomerase